MKEEGSRAATTNVQRRKQIDREMNRNSLQVNPTLSLWRDFDSNRNYLIENTGKNEAIYVDAVG